MQALFSKAMPSSQALDYISRFAPISSREAVREALERCMLTAFSRYARELEEMQDSYERNKVSTQREGCDVWKTSAGSRAGLG